MDYAQARYYASVQGRFISVDPALESADVTIPQSWNRYTYCINNPLLYTDPTGEVWVKDQDNNRHWIPYDQWDAASRITRDGRPLYTPLTQEEMEYDSVNGKRVRLLGSGPTADNPGGFIYVGPNQGGSDNAALAGTIVLTGGRSLNPWALAATAAAGGIIYYAGTHDLLMPPLIWSEDNNTNGNANNTPPSTPSPDVSQTPATNPDAFEPIRGSSAKRNRETGEIWVRDPSRHGGEHYEVYRNRRAYERGDRDRAV